MNYSLYACALVHRYGREILASPGMQQSRLYLQHGHVSVYSHSLAVALACVAIATRLHIRADQRALVRGALLHDYFLYDWHHKDASHRWHGVHHAARALQNAQRDFTLRPVERDMILRHMFPLNLHPPRTREGVLLCLADKLCATREVVSGRLPRRSPRTG